VRTPQPSILNSSTPTIAKRLWCHFSECGSNRVRETSRTGLINVVIIRPDMSEQIYFSERFPGDSISEERIVR
jgi:hypothetical protein